MQWAGYRKGSKKAKVHPGFDLNHSIPRKIFLTEDKGAERPFVNMILSLGQTGVWDRGYQAHNLFGQWQKEDKYFVCRIKAGTQKTLIEAKLINGDSNVFYDATVLLDRPGVNQGKEPVRLVGYTIDVIKRVRKLRIKIQNETRTTEGKGFRMNFENQNFPTLYAST